MSMKFFIRLLIVLAVVAGAVSWLKPSAVIIRSDDATPGDASPVEWVGRELLSLLPNDIVSVSVIGTNDEFMIRRDEGGLYQVGRIGEGATVDQAAVSQLMTVFQSLRLESVTDPAFDDEQAGIARHEIAMLRMRNELMYELKFGAAREGAGTRALRIAVSYRPESGQPQEKPELVAEADAINRRFAGRTFTVPNEMAEHVMTTRAALVVRPVP